MITGVTEGAMMEMKHNTYYVPDTVMPGISKQQISTMT